MALSDLRKVASYLLLPLLLFGCAQQPVQERGVRVTTAGPLTEEGVPRGRTLRIASFNIQNFGPTKLKRKDIMKVLAQVALNFDIMAIQEVSDKNLKVIPGLLDAISAQGGVYQGLVSPRTGRQPDDLTSQEQYAFVYNARTVTPLDRGLLFDDENDLFQREPFLARFRSLFGSFTFVLINIHTQPERAVAEIGALDSVNEWAHQRYPDEDDFVTLGDFNGSCDYASPEELDKLRIRGEDYFWIVPDDADTNLSEKPCAYDRMVLGRNVKEYTGRWGVLKAFTDKRVSDHWPIWAEFQVVERN